MASRTADEDSTVASSSSMSRFLHDSRAISVEASELASAGFHTTPTFFRLGFASRARLNSSSTGCRVP